MARRNSGGRSSGRAAPRAAPMRNPPQTTRSAPPPAPAQAGGSLLGSIGATIAEGFGLATGFSIAQRAIDAVLGPCTILLEKVEKEEVAAAPTAPPANASLGSDACNIHSKAFQDCINNFGSEISKCQFYLDMLNECRRESGAVLTA